MIRKLWPYARPYSGWIAAGILCSAMDAIFQLLIPLVMSDIVDVGIANADQGYILRKGVLMVALAMGALLFGLGGAGFSSVAGMGFGSNLRRAEYEHIQNFAFSNIERFSTASLVTRLTNDVRNLEMSLMMSMRLMVRAPVMLVSALVLSVRISYQLSSVFLAALPLLIVVVVTILIRVGPMFRSLQEKTDALNLVVQENLSNIRVVKSFVREDREEEKSIRLSSCRYPIKTRSCRTRSSGGSRPGALLMRTVNWRFGCPRNMKIWRTLSGTMHPRLRSSSSRRSPPAGTVPAPTFW